MKKLHATVVSRATRAVLEPLEERRLLSASIRHASAADVITSSAATVTPADVTHPSVLDSSPANNTTSVLLDSAITADLNLPNGGLDSTTVTTANVYLQRRSDNSIVAATVKTSGGGDSIVLQPTANLQPNTSYNFVVTAGVKDQSGVTFTPYQIAFKTGTAVSNANPTVQFTKVAIPTATGAPFTCVATGPDGKLYASTEDGDIYRWTINSDGTLGTAQVITSLVSYEGANRLITGFAFDPSSTANNLKIWVSNSYDAVVNSPDWTSKITTMSGPDLGTVQDAVINLPRSNQDHGLEQPVFGPDGALYVCQGSMSAMGAPDSTWGNRPEHVLSAAILRLNTSLLPTGSALDVKTVDGGGTYNPYAAGAPLTLYATGVRNAFDLVWASNGKLYAAGNGSSAGGNTPASSSGGEVVPRIDTGANYAGPSIPALTDLSETEPDFLYTIQQGKYYGHPDPARGEYVLDGGNTGTTTDDTITEYPAGTQPDSNYVAPTFEYGDHRSPDGSIQYVDHTFGGVLNGALISAEYAGGGDLAIVSLNGSGGVSGVQRGNVGTTGFNDPVDLTETSNGDIYVAELGGQKLTLLVPVPVVATATVSKTLQVFNGVVGTATAAQAITIKNTGTATLTISSVSIIDDSSVGGDDSSAFAISNSGSIATSLAPGASTTVNVTFDAGHTNLNAADLQIVTNDSTRPTQLVSLHGLGQNSLNGGGDEPSLAAILRAYGIPTIVGDGPNDANEYASTYYPLTPDPSSQEVTMQNMVKAGSGPVSVSLLATFVNNQNPATRLGYFQAGNAAAKTELWTTPGSQNQSVNVTANGATAFDPGSSAFGLYGVFPNFTDNGHKRVAYSEDVLNVYDTGSEKRKVRFFPLENANGSVVPNAYVFAMEDWDAADAAQYNIPPAQAYDSNDIVGIIRNVKPALAASGSPTLDVQDPSAVPGSNNVVFSRIQNRNTGTGATDLVHDTDTLTLTNTGTAPLTLNSFTLSDPTNWTLVNPPAAGTTLAAGASTTLTIKFIATTDPAHTGDQTNAINDTTDNNLAGNAAGGVYNGTLTINSNDPNNGSRVVNLAGYWQDYSEYSNEPNLQTVVNKLFNFGTNISNTTQNLYPNNGSTAALYGEEVQSAFWDSADSSQPVTVTQIAAYHSQFNSGTTTYSIPLIGYYPKTGGSTTVLYYQKAEYGQTVYPLQQNGTAAAASFSPTAAFAWNIDGEHSNDSSNTTDINTYHRSGHSIRIYPVRDASGNLVPNAYLLAMDYQNGSYDNSDFQDNVYLVTNVRPDNGISTPGDVQATAATDGSGSVNVQWKTVTDSGVTGYNVYSSNAINGTYTKLNPSVITGNSFNDAYAAAGSTTYYKVTAVNSSTESLGSAAAVLTIPAAPTQLTATATADNQITLNWTASTGAASYRIEREAAGGSSFTEIAYGVTGTGFTDTYVAGGTTYIYQIRAENSAGISGYSDVASAAGTGSTTSVPTPPDQNGGGQSSGSNGGGGTATNEGLLPNITIPASPSNGVSDLAATIAIKGKSTSYLGGAKTTATITIVNNSSHTVTGTQLYQVILSNDGTASTDDVLLGQLSKKLSLKPHKSMKVTVKLTTPSVLQNGTYQVLLVASGGTSSSGLPEANVTASAAAITLAKPYSSVTATGTAAGSVVVGKSLASKITLANAGNVNAKGTATIVYTLTPSDGSAATTLTTVRKSVSFKATSRKTLSTKLKIPANLAAGTYTLTATVSTALSPASTAASQTVNTSLSLVAAPVKAAKK